MRLLNRGGWLCAAVLSLAACSAATSTPPATAGNTVPPIVEAAATAADLANVPAPVTFADRTTLDETAGIGFETAIAAAADLATLAVKTKVVPSSRLVELRERVAWARVAVGSVRAAYDANNATSYRAAVATASCAIGRVRSLASGAPDAPCGSAVR